MVISSAAKFDLSMFLGHTSEGLAGEVEYTTDLFDAATVTRLIGHYQNVLAAIAVDPETPIRDVPLMSPIERNFIAQCSVAKNAAEILATPALERLLADQIARTPSAVAVEFDGATITYREIDCRVNQLTRRLRRLGAGRDRVVAIALGRSIDTVVAVLAVLRSGSAYLPLDPDYPPSRLAMMLDDARPIAMIAPDANARFARATTVPIVSMAAPGDDEAQTIEAGPSDAPIGPEDLAYVIYTSGSSGRPKGVAMPHRTLVDLVRWHISDPELGRPARTLQFASWSFDVSCQELLTTLATGGTLVILDETRRRDPHALLEYITAMRIERLFLPPVALAAIADAATVSAHVPTTVREIITAGEALSISPERSPRVITTTASGK